MNLSKKGSTISHLFFIDDLIIFFEASFDQVNMINSCLEIFSTLFGQNVRKEKTWVFFSRNMNHNKVRQLSENLKVQLTSILGKFLRVPLHYKKVSKSTYRFIINKVQEKDFFLECKDSCIG